MNSLDQAIQKGYALAAEGKEKSAFLLRDTPLFIVQSTKDSEDPQENAGIAISDSSFARFYYDPDNHAVILLGAKSARQLFAERDTAGKLKPQKGYVKNSHVIGARLLKEEQRGNPPKLTEGDIEFFKRKFKHYSGNLNHISHRHYTYHAALDAETGAELYFNKRFGCVLMPNGKSHYDVYGAIPILRRHGSHVRLNQKEKGYIPHFKYKIASNLSLKDARAEQKKFWDTLTHLIWSGQNVNEMLPAIKNSKFQLFKAWNWLLDKKQTMGVTALSTGVVGLMFGKHVATKAFLYLCAAHIAGDLFLEGSHRALAQQLSNHKNMKRLKNIRAFEVDNRDVTDFYRDIKTAQDFRKICLHPNTELTQNTNGYYLPFETVKIFSQDAMPFINNIDLMTLERSVILARQRASTVEIQNLGNGILIGHFAEGVRSLFHAKANHEINFAVQDAPEFNTKAALRLPQEYEELLEDQRILQSTYNPRELDFAKITTEGRISNLEELIESFSEAAELSGFQTEIIAANFNNEAWAKQQESAAYHGDPAFDVKPLPMI